MAPMTTQDYNNNQEHKVPEQFEALHGDEHQPPTNTCTLGDREGALPKDDTIIPDTLLYYAHREHDIFDLYEVGSLKRGKSVPFVHDVQLDRPKGEVVRLRSVFDDGAMVNAIDASIYKQVQNQLAPLQPSSRILRMADGRLVPSDGIWKGTVHVSKAAREATFEVFQSSGAWALLFGKPLLKEFCAVHEYGPSIDVVRVPHNGDWLQLENQFNLTKGVAAPLLVGLTTDIKQHTSFKGDQCASPSRQVSPVT
ncbi:hypothetical protein DXG01_001188 [Tephrocybe rancida]|nr:hypothetical protein DXG01_001188 [Tephrocybe rancida]